VWGTAATVVVEILGFFFGASSAADQKGEQKPVVKLHPGQEEELSQITDKMAMVGFEVCVRLLTKSGNVVRSEQLLRDSIASFKQFTTANLNSFVQSRTKKTSADMYNEYQRRFLTADTVIF
jgi:hypothetical protein